METTETERTLAAYRRAIDFMLFRAVLPGQEGSPIPAGDMSDDRAFVSERLREAIRELAGLDPDYQPPMRIGYPHETRDNDREGGN